MMRIFNYKEVKDILERREVRQDVSGLVGQIIDGVRMNGDESLRRYAIIFDGAAPERLEVTRSELDRAVDGLDPELRAILEEAAMNIRDYHRHQNRNSFVISEKDGVVLGQKVTPLDRVGLYIPGGTASYPSTVLMNAIPAKLAGCPEVVMVSPPSRDGDIAPVILAAARIAGVDRVFRVGGAQAIAALAYGTQTIPKVDKIVGPGNANVAEEIGRAHV